MKRRSVARGNYTSAILKVSGFALFLLFLVAVVFLFRYVRGNRDVPSLKEIYDDWQTSSYTSVHLKSARLLQDDPFNPELLAFNGFSSYYIYVSESEDASTLGYLENAVISLRQAMYFADKKDIPKIAYILGKAYYQKGEYYADLALKYLEIAENSQEAGEHNFSDLQEFKGMASVSLKQFEKAVNSFTQALKETSSPFLLYVLAETYMKMKDFQNAKQYFFQTITKTQDEILQLKCRYQIGTILFDENDFEGAKREFVAILEKDEASAEAHYGLGLVFEKEGDMVRARSEWRRALKANPLHEKTQGKIKNLS